MAGLSCLLVLPQFLYAQNKTIARQITDAKVMPVPGATIAVNNAITRALLQMLQANLAYLFRQ